MLRQAFRLRQRSILQQVHFPATYNTRTFHRTTRKTYHSASTAKSSPHFSASLDGKVNNIQSEMAATKSEMKSGTAATKSEMAHLARQINMIDTEMKSLSNNLTMQMKNLIDTVSTQIDALNANMELRTANMELNMDSRLDKLENRFNLLFGMLFAVSGLRIYYTAF
jgi:septal ring factor EnvC (AmiA/AmiB activator)